MIWVVKHFLKIFTAIQFIISLCRDFLLTVIIAGWGRRKTVGPDDRCSRDIFPVQVNNTAKQNVFHQLCHCMTFILEPSWVGLPSRISQAVFC